MPWAKESDTQTAPSCRECCVHTDTNEMGMRNTTEGDFVAPMNVSLQVTASECARMRMRWHVLYHKA
eukprot:2762896-Amphidinium_carterae.1